MGFALAGQGVGQGIAQALQNRFGLPLQLKALERNIPAAQAFAQKLQGPGGQIDPLTASLLGINIPKPSLTDTLSQLLLGGMTGLGQQIGPGQTGGQQALPPISPRPTRPPVQAAPQTSILPDVIQMSTGQLQAQGITIPQGKVAGVGPDGKVVLADSAEELTQAGFRPIQVQ